MSKQSLPLVDAARTEFGFDRTVCACHECTLNCHHMPGYLIPANLERIHQHLSPSEDLYGWASKYLLASPGAILTHHDRSFRISTLVPARQPDGACIFLSKADQCAIHAVSPYGCAFFDWHMANTEADRRSKQGLQAVLDAWQTGHLYARVWVALAIRGLMAPAPEVARQHLRQACDGKRPW